MKLRTTGWILALVTAAGLIAADSANSAGMMMEAAHKKEVVDGDLKGAIKAYGAIVARYTKTDRAVAAMALVHMAECYQKTGDAESKKIYEQVVKDYADQKDAVAMARAGLGNYGAAQNPGIATRQVLTGIPAARTLGVSPDGRFLVFNGLPPDGGIAIHDLTTGEDRTLLPESSRSADLDPLISHDGKQIAYVHEALGADGETYELREIDLNGGAQPRTLLKGTSVDLSLRDWSTDGKWLAVQVFKEDGTSQFGLFSLAEGTLRILKSMGSSLWTPMIFSPDGKYLAYNVAADDSGQRDIHILATDGSRDTPVVVHPANDMVVGWSPDGRRLLFASDRSGSKAIWQISVSEGKPQGAAESIRVDVNVGDVLGLTRAGALYYRPNLEEKDFYVASIDFETARTIDPPRKATQGQSFGSHFSAWSPDGKYLALIVSPIAGRDSRDVLAIRSTETGGVRELKPNLIRFWEPVWSADDSYLVVQGEDAKGQSGFYRVDPQTGSATFVAKGSPGIALSPDGRTLYFRRSDARANVLVALEMQSGKEREVARLAAADGFLGNHMLSPDGRFLTVARREAGSGRTSSLRLVPVDGGTPRELMNFAPDSIGGWLWSPDGKSFLATRLSTNAGRLSANNDTRRTKFFLGTVDGGQLRELGSSPAEPLWPIAWSPDGRFLVLKACCAGDLWRMAVEGGDLRKIDLNGIRPADIGLSFSGNRIAFSNYIGNESAQVLVMENLLPKTTAAIK